MRSAIDDCAFRKQKLNDQKHLSSISHFGQDPGLFPSPFSPDFLIGTSHLDKLLDDTLGEANFAASAKHKEISFANSLHGALEP